jgi:hypothetical protein
MEKLKEILMELQFSVKFHTSSKQNVEKCPAQNTDFKPTTY